MAYIEIESPKMARLSAPDGSTPQHERLYCTPCDADPAYSGGAYAATEAEARAGGRDLQAIYSLPDYC